MASVPVNKVNGTDLNNVNNNNRKRRRGAAKNNNDNNEPKRNRINRNSNNSNNTNSNSSNSSIAVDTIETIKEEIRDVNETAAQLYKRVDNTYDLQFNPLLYVAYIDEYINDNENLQDKTSMLYRIVLILLDNPRTGWKCIDEESLIFDSEDIKWMDDNLKGRKKNQVLLQIFKDLKIYFEVTQIQGKRLLFIYNDSIGLKWSRLNNKMVRTTSVTSWLQHDHTTIRH